MSSLKQSDKVVDILNKYSSNFCIMHTNSAYPTPNDELNLSLIPFLLIDINVQLDIVVMKKI